MENNETTQQNETKGFKQGFREGFAKGRQATGTFVQRHKGKLGVMAGAVLAIGGQAAYGAYKTRQGRGMSA